MHCILPIKHGDYMIKALGSKHSIDNNELTSEYYDTISDLLDSDIVNSMKKFTHHYSTTCFQHSLNVSYYNYIICRKLGLDANSAARAGLLHDLFLYNRKTYVRTVGEKLHGYRHPHIALSNAQEHFQLNKREKDIIVKHMWPLTLSMPKYSETFVIVFVDKYCGIIEMSQHVINKVKKLFSNKSYA